MNTGIVLNMDRKWAYVMTSDCRMVRVHAKPHMTIGREIRMETEIARDVRPAPTRRMKLAWAMAPLAVILVLGLVFGQGILFNPVYARLSIDINPSLEMALNRNLEVVSVQAMNQEAKQVLEGLAFKFRGLQWEDAMGKWVEAVRAKLQIQVQTVLVSAVMPEDAVQLRTRLQEIEGTQNEGALKGIQVRAIYSYNGEVANEANRNGLSVGRQMLLDQARRQNRNYDEAEIAEAPVGDLIQALLQNQEQNQTGGGGQNQEQNGGNGGSGGNGGGGSGSGSGDPSATPQGDQNQEQNQEQNGPTSGGQNQEQNGATNGAGPGPNDPSCTPQGDQNQEQNGPTSGGQNQEQNGVTDGAGPGPNDPSCTPQCTPACTPQGEPHCTPACTPQGEPNNPDVTPGAGGKG